MFVTTTNFSNRYVLIAHIVELLPISNKCTIYINNISSLKRCCISEDDVQTPKHVAVFSERERHIVNIYCSFVGQM
jgi:hypothetical protein